MGVADYEKKAGGDLSRDMDAAEPGAEEAVQSDEPAEEVENPEQVEDREDAGDEGGDSTPPSEPPARDVPTMLKREARPLQRGEAFDSPFGPLPVRSLTAMAAIVVVGVVVYMAMWALLGTLGLLLGWIPAIALGFLAGREVGMRTG